MRQRTFATRGAAKQQSADNNNNAEHTQNVQGGDELEIKIMVRQQRTRHAPTA